METSSFPTDVFSQNRCGGTSPFFQPVPGDSGSQDPRKFIDSPLQVSDIRKPVLNKQVTGQKGAYPGVTVNDDLSISGNAVEIVRQPGQGDVDGLGKSDKPVFPLLPDIKENTLRSRPLLSILTGKNLSQFLTGNSGIGPAKEGFEVPDPFSLGLIRERRAVSGGRQFLRFPSRPDPGGGPCLFWKRNGVQLSPAPRPAPPVRS